MKLILIRHGQSEADLTGVIECNADFNLTEKGREQAAKLVEILVKYSPFDAIYSSPLKRAYNTAEIIAGKFNMTVVTDKRLSERNVGKMAGMSREEASKIFPMPEGGLKPHHKMGGGTGESALDFRHRICEFFHELEEKHKNDRVAVVSHGGAISLFLQELLKTQSNVSFSTGDTGFHYIEIKNEKVTIHFLNNLPSLT